MSTYRVEYTDTFGGEANYSWVRRYTLRMPELTHYGYSGSTDGTYGRASRTYQRELMKAAKAAAGLTGLRGETCPMGDGYKFRPYGMCTVLFVNYQDNAS